VKRLMKMLKNLIDAAGEEELKLTPFVRIAMRASPIANATTARSNVDRLG
jgi:hypothetical protein